MSNNTVAKFFLELDVRRKDTDPALKPRKFSDSVISDSPNRISILVFTGSKENGARAFRESDLVSPDCTSSAKKMMDALVAGVDARTQEVIRKHLDVRYLMPSHMPQYLRIDKDVRAELLKLSRMIKQYSNFDVLALDREVTRTMEIELDRQSADYKKHRHEVEKKLKVAKEKLEQCILAKDEII